MLRCLRAKGFKSLTDVSIGLGRLTVLFGPNAVGKSNVVDALQVLSRIAGERTLEEAVAPPVRGYASELFTLPRGGLEELLGRDSVRLDLGAEVVRAGGGRGSRFGYRIGVSSVPRVGALTNADELLTRLTKDGQAYGNARIERVGDHFVVRANHQGHPRHLPVPINHALLSDPTLTAPYFRDIAAVRDELRSWRSYYLDPANAMRRAAPPREVTDIGPRGEDLAPFLYRLRNDHRPRFDAVARAVRQVIPAVRQVDVELDTRRGTLDLRVEQDGVWFSSRVISEGTLRIIAIACLAATPFPAGLVAFEEPENGVHPRRVEMVARLLTDASRRSQVVVTTHSPTFLAEMLRISRESPNGHGSGITVFACTLEAGATVLRPFPDPGPLLAEGGIAAALTASSEEAAIEAAYVAGWLDG